MPATEAQRARARDLRLQRTYGITSEQYEQMRADQRGVCAICKQPPKKLPLNVDHDHESGLVRGLLCWNCNHRLLPTARDDAARLQRAADYLRYPPAVRTLGRIIAPILKPVKRRRRKSTTKEKQLGR